MKKTHLRLTHKQNEMKKADKEIVIFAHKNFSYKDAIEFIKNSKRIAE